MHNGFMLFCALNAVKGMVINMEYNVDICHKELLKKVKPTLAFDENCNYDSWRIEVKEKLIELLGDMPEKTELNIRVEWEKEDEEFIEKRIVFTSEKYVDVPCHLWIPKSACAPVPAVICLQGHSTGMHISMGRSIYQGDNESISNGDRDFARQIVKEGYAALVLEQRGFGERKSEAFLKFDPEARTTCWHPAMTAILLGRTLIGERVWDISRAIDVLETMPEIDSKKIAVMGNSGGGTATYYAACMDERIKIAMPSCSVCTFKDSIVAGVHCMCNYIPSMAKYLDMGDLACLIAPRPLVMVSGELDHGFFIEGCRETAKTIADIYKSAGAEENFRFVVGEEGHRFYADMSWSAFRELSGW